MADDDSDDDPISPSRALSAIDSAHGLISDVVKMLHTITTTQVIKLIDSERQLAELRCCLMHNNLPPEAQLERARSVLGSTRCDRVVEAPHAPALVSSLRRKQYGGHMMIRVWVHGAYAGELTFRLDEWEPFVRLLGFEPERVIVT